MGADSRVTAGSGGVLNNIFMGFSGYTNTFEAASNVFALPAPLTNNVARLGKKSKIHSQEFSACDPIFGAPWNHSVLENQNRVECLGSGTKSPPEHYERNRNSVHEIMTGNEVVDFVKGAIKEVCRKEWCTGGDIHVVVLATSFCRKFCWELVNPKDCMSAYHKKQRH